MWSINNIVTVSALSVFFFHSFFSFVQGVDQSCAKLEELTCDNSPCECSELENCNSCNDDNSIPCSQCANGFFRPNGDYKCANCYELFGDTCDFCTNNRGCQQCADGINMNPIQNECGLYTCDTETFEPTDAPTDAPTNSPTVDIQSFLQQFVTDFLGCGLTIEEVAEIATDDFEICMADIGCGGLELSEKFLCICDVEVLAAVRDVETDNEGRFIFSYHYEACKNSERGLFWTSGPRSTEIDVNTGKVKRFILGWNDETDVDFINQWVNRDLE